MALFFYYLGIWQKLDSCDTIKKNLNPEIKIEGVLLTMFDKRTNLSLQVVEEVRTNFNGNVFETVIPRNIRLAEAPSYGEPITTYDSGSRGAESYRLLAAELMNKN